MKYKRCVDDSGEPFVRLKPVLLKQSDDWSDRTVVGKNIAEYFAVAYAAAYGGKPTENGKGSFHPDVSRNTLFGCVDTEVKAMSVSNGRSFASPRQAERYAERVLLNVEEGQRAPTTDYAIFTYGDTKTRVASLSNKKLMARLPRMINNLTSMPSNLAYALAITGGACTMNRVCADGSQSPEFYRRIHNCDITELHKSPNEALEVIRGRIDEKCLEDLTSDDFMLDELVFRREDFPRGIRCWGHEVNMNGFPVLRFILPDTKAWADKYAEKQEQFSMALRGDTKNSFAGIPV